MAEFDFDRWRKVSPHLDRVLDLPEAERAGWLASLRARDASLAVDVETLLIEHHALVKEQFLERTVSVPSPSGEGHWPRPGPLSGRTLGGFCLKEIVGAGGFGDVYLAEQVEFGVTRW